MESRSDFVIRNKIQFAKDENKILEMSYYYQVNYSFLHYITSCQKKLKNWKIEKLKNWKIEKLKNGNQLSIAINISYFFCRHNSVYQISNPLNASLDFPYNRKARIQAENNCFHESSLIESLWCLFQIATKPDKYL